MDFDVEGNLAATTRTVSSLERDGRPARAVTLSRGYDTTVDDLWDAVTSRERIPRWFAPVSGDLELGGRYQLEGNAGGAITTCERPSHFALTWEFGGDVSWVDVRVSDDGAGRARLTLAHIAHLSPHWDEYGPGATGVGWEMGLLGLALHLADPTAPKLDEEAFAASRDGRAFIAGSSDGWGEAAVAAGEDPGAARAAAGRIKAFYAGEPAQPA
ncbi:MAG: SRPBCC domain-containing protein [Acidobacteria bacterium]|nr:SRPBCC domain-containing protein [Acidobacteriota bacterium]